MNAKWPAVAILTLLLSGCAPTPEVGAETERWPTVYVMEVRMRGSPVDPDYPPVARQYVEFLDFPGYEIDDANRTVRTGSYPADFPIHSKDLLILGHVERTSPAVVRRQECYHLGYGRELTGLEMENLRFAAVSRNDVHVDLRFGAFANGGYRLFVGRGVPFHATIIQEAEELALLEEQGDTARYQKLSRDFEYDVEIIYHGPMQFRPSSDMEEFYTYPAALPPITDDEHVALGRDRWQECHGV